MSWDATIFGTLEMSPADYKTWLGRPVDSAQVPDADKHLSTLEVKGESVEKELQALETFQDEEGLAFLEIEQDAAHGKISVRSFFSKDEYLDNCVTLAAIWAAAAPSAKGELIFAGMLTADFCYQLTVGTKGVTLVMKKSGFADSMDVYEEIQARVEARVEELGL